MLITLLLACNPLVGDWSGELDCGSAEGDIAISLDFRDGAYVGDGELDCEWAYGGVCEERFEVNIDPVGPFGEQPIAVDLDDCEITLWGITSDIDCDDQDDLVWDGADTISGEWADCDVELERD
jgi:hypothetical protein